MSKWKKAPLNRLLSTVGIGPVFVRSPPDPLYSHQSSTKAPDSVLTWEIVGTIKSKPEDFVVREISYLPTADGEWSSRIAGLDENSGCSLSTDFIDITSCRRIESAAGARQRLNDTNNESTSAKPAIAAAELNPPPEKSSSTDVKSDSVSPSNNKPALNTLTERLQKILKLCCSENKRSGSDATTSSDEGSSAADTTIEQLGLLQELALDEIHELWQKGYTNTSIATSDETVNSDQSKKVWIPTSNLFQCNFDNLKDMWKELHQCIRLAFPLLKTEVPNSGPTTNKLCCDAEDKSFRVDTSDKSLPQSSVKPWVCAEIDTSFYALAPYLAKPREDLLLLYNFRKVGPVESAVNAGQRNDRKRKRQKEQQNEKEIESGNGHSYVLLRLRPELPREERRNVHNLLCSTSRNRRRDFDTFTKNGVLLDANSSYPKPPEACNSEEVTRVAAVVVQWSRPALEGSKKKYKQKAGGNAAEAKDVTNRIVTLCVLRKEQTEHQVAVQELTRTIKCRQSDIGLAGIKDMQAITYQFCTLRNIDARRAEQRNRTTKKITLSQVQSAPPGFMLDRGMLLGNRFDITIRDLGRIEQQCLSDGDQPSDARVTPMERVVPCRASHIDEMVKRIQECGFVNFYGEQRVGDAGDSNQVGARAFDVGRAMLQNDFAKAIDLVMTGRSDAVYSPSEDEIKAREVWKTSGGDARATLNAFPKKSSVMVRERDLMKGLLRFGNALDAFRGIPHNIRMFWIHAYQSYIWNLAATERIKKWGVQPAVGDLYILDQDFNVSDQVGIVENPDTVDISQIVLPVRMCRNVCCFFSLYSYRTHCCFASVAPWLQSSIPIKRSGTTLQRHTQT